MKKITILIPCYNEAESLPWLMEALRRFVDGSYTVHLSDEEVCGDVTVDMRHFEWEFLMVNDGSTDRTASVLEEFRRDDPRVSVLNLARNFGKENAMLAGMDYFEGDALLIMDADMQHPLSSIPEMVCWWQQGYDDVYGRRTDGNHESRVRTILTRCFYDILQHTSRIRMIEGAGDFRLMDRRMVRAIVSLRETQRYSKGLFCWVGFRKKGVDYKSESRIKGKSSFNILSLSNLAIEGIVGNSTMPLRISTFTGILVSMLAFFYLVVILVRTLIWGDPVSGFPTLICVILFLGGMQLLALGIIGEYVGRIFNEAKHRPPYIVESYNGRRDGCAIEG